MIFKVLLIDDSTGIQCQLNKSVLNENQTAKKRKEFVIK